MEEIFFRKFGSGKSILLIHGFCETQEIWSGFAERLAENFEVFTIDLPGFGQSPLPSTPISIDDISQRVLAWIDREKISSPCVIGHSLGGYVTLAMGNQGGSLLAGLALFHSTPYPDNEERKSNRNRVIEFVKKNGVDLFVDTFVPGLFFNKTHSSISFVDRIARATAKETLLAYTAAMRDRPSSVDFLKGFEKPVLVLGGEKDSIIPVESVLAIGNFVKRGAVHILKDAGHMAMFEQPEIALNILSGFIRGT